MLQSARPVCSSCRMWGIQCDYSVSVGSTSQPAPASISADYTAVAVPNGTRSWEFRQHDMHSSFPFSENPETWDSDASQLWNPAPSHNSALYPTVQDLLSFDSPQLPEPYADLLSSSTIPWPSPGYKTTDFPMSVSVLSVSFPPESQILELIDIFFAQFHVYIPCFHQTTFLNLVKTQELQRQAPALLLCLNRNCCPITS